MTSSTKRPMSLLVAVGVVLLIAGLLAAMWLDEWRWAATGVAVLLLAFTIAGYLQDRHTPRG